MSYDYEKLYASEPHALGGQTKTLAAYLKTVAPKPVRILDVGCGQGRDALPLARAGHDVTGVDLSPSGVAAMCAEAEHEGLRVTGHVADITTYTPDGLFDVLLIDRTLHMLERDTRLATFAALLGAVKDGGWLVMADESANLPDFRAALVDDARVWAVERCGKGVLFARQTG